ncbi:hypothetical protein EMIHUDRAFT_205594 [Emiliania huxleyi CCMP1516]|uniref:Uncharacterized protein n=2 Tax=Emiliania huxleyi TaxID=2903 RepID=A0A0D3JSN2_EMIH1|nr:hypothetical protein EMIHUDRAFT_205594 [Emiliania huxleyi CCMP1516]EOD26517.1 hypothetical protein EMIHUDRAFT_205594 [Emiliania huxleyi CCMP1516]|eukprot:XP_005778946.1 hypothetical protein EMIHUDRAFT_205594 [Emiliania huxleyi CCMP1516]
MSTGKEASVPSDAAAPDRLNGSVGAAAKRPRDSEGAERYGGPASNPKAEALSENLGCAHAHGCCESSEAELARRELLELITAPDADGTWNMTRARMRQHEYYFIVQRRLARHYCWLELLSRPTSSRCWVSAAHLLTVARQARGQGASVPLVAAQGNAETRAFRTPRSGRGRGKAELAEAPSAGGELPDSSRPALTKCVYLSVVDVACEIQYRRSIAI